MDLNLYHQHAEFISLQEKLRIYCDKRDSYRFEVASNFRQTRCLDSYPKDATYLEVPTSRPRCTSRQKTAF